MKCEDSRQNQDSALNIFRRLAEIAHALTSKECRTIDRELINNNGGLDYNVPQSLETRVLVDAVAAASVRARTTSDLAQAGEVNQMRSNDTSNNDVLSRIHTRPQVHRRWAFLAAGIGLAVLIILSIIRYGTLSSIANADPMVVISMSGKVDNSKGHLYKLGDKVPIGTIIETGNDSRATLITRKGTQIHLDSNTRYKLASATGTKIISGRAFLSNRMGEIKQIATPAGKVRLLGTQVNTAVLPSKAVAVTVVSGKVKLLNSHGNLMLDAGKKAVFTAQNAPSSPVSVDVAAETAWYDGRGKIVSDFGQIAYVVDRPGSPISEIWAMNEDGSGKHRLKSLVGNIGPGSWLSGQQWLKLDGFVSLCWNYPDYKTRKASGRSGTPFFWGMPVTTINAATGQDGVVELPPGFSPIYSVLSPDGTYLAFIHNKAFADGKGQESGLWVCSLCTGEVRQLLNGFVGATPAWSPDSRRIVIANGQVVSISPDGPNGYLNQHMVIVDAETGEIDDLGFNGAGAAYSPDGSKLAYVGDFDDKGNGSVCILDPLNPGNPIRLTEGRERPFALRWSPDGSQLMYYIREVDWEENRASQGAVLPESYSIKIVKTDGSELKTIFQEDLRMPLFRGCEWAADGQTVYVRKTDSILVIATDGSGVIANLGGNASDSILPQGEQQQTEAAAKAIEEAVFQYAVAEHLTYDGKVKEAKAAYQASAEIFESIAWKYPLANLSVSNIQLYADVVGKKAAMTEKQLLEASCQKRMSFLGIPLHDHLEHEKAFPPDLETLRQFSQEHGGGIINWMNLKEDAEKAALMYRCPLDGQPYQYTMPDMNSIKPGDVVVTCLNHPQSKVKVEEYWLP